MRLGFTGEKALQRNEACSIRRAERRRFSLWRLDLQNFNQRNPAKWLEEFDLQNGTEFSAPWKFLLD
jgi:hypothetical protein